MRVIGRDRPIVELKPTEEGGVIIHIGFELYLAGWVTIELTQEDLNNLLNHREVKNVDACKPDCQPS